MNMNNIDLGKASAFVENVNLQVSASSQIGEDLDEVKRLGEERCHGVYCLRNPIRLNVELMQARSEKN